MWLYRHDPLSTKKMTKNDVVEGGRAALLVAQKMPRRSARRTTARPKSGLILVLNRIETRNAKYKRFIRLEQQEQRQKEVTDFDKLQRRKARLQKELANVKKKLEEADSEKEMRQFKGVLEEAVDEDSTSRHVFQRMNWESIETIRLAKVSTKRCKSFINHTWPEFEALVREFAEDVRNTTWKGKRRQRLHTEKDDKYPIPYCIFLALYWAKTAAPLSVIGAAMYVSERTIPKVVMRVFYAMYSKGSVGHLFTCSCRRVS